MEDEWIVILLMNVMVVMRLMIRTICQRIPRPSSTLHTLSTQENCSPVLKPSLACQIFLFENLSISPGKKTYTKEAGLKKELVFCRQGH